MANARDRMNDYRKIALKRHPWKRLVPEVAFRIHQESLQFIESSLLADSMPTVVVTHHLPHPRSIPERFKGDLLNAAYASDLTETIRNGSPVLWVHGHTHDSFDYRILETRVVCNPRGYGSENESFNPGLVITV